MNILNETTVSSCCGSKSRILDLDKAIKKNHLAFFADKGYLIPEHYTKSGIFFVQKKFFTATASFGSTKIRLGCSGKDCEEKVNEFKEFLKQL